MSRPPFPANFREFGRWFPDDEASQRLISNLKAWLIGTHHGVGRSHLEAYLGEFVFRFDRRHAPTSVRRRTGAR
ncbi:MAG: transposase [Candidatus Limnocylindrales bacterium]